MLPVAQSDRHPARQESKVNADGGLALQEKSTLCSWCEVTLSLGGARGQKKSCLKLSRQSQLCEESSPYNEIITQFTLKNSLHFNKKGFVSGNSHLQTLKCFVFPASGVRMSSEEVCEVFMTKFIYKKKKKNSFHRLSVYQLKILNPNCYPQQSNGVMSHVDREGHLTVRMTPEPAVPRRTVSACILMRTSALIQLHVTALREDTLHSSCARPQGSVLTPTFIGRHSAPLPQSQHFLFLKPPQGCEQVCAPCLCSK